MLDNVRWPISINWKHSFKILMDAVDDYAIQWCKHEKTNVVYKSHYKDCLIKELCIDNLLGNHYVYQYDIYERGNPAQSYICFAFFWKLHQRTGASIIIDS